MKLQRVGKQILDKMSRIVPVGNRNKDIADLGNSIMVGKSLYRLINSDSWKTLQAEILNPALIRYQHANFYGQTPDEREGGRIGMKILIEDIEKKITELIERSAKAELTLSQLKEKRG